MTVVISNSEDVFQELHRPEVMAASWTGAWPDPAMNFVQNLLRKPAYAQSSASQIPLSDVREIAFPKGDNISFRRSLGRFQALFERLGVELCGNSKIGFQEGSRIETNRYGLRDDDWHTDTGQLIMLSTPVGPTTEYIDSATVAGYKWPTVFIEDEEKADKTAISLPQNSITIFKGNDFSFVGTGKEGFVHRRPNTKLSQERARTRLVYHCFYG